MAIALRRTAEVDLEFVVQTESHPENRPFVRQWSIEQHRASLEDPAVGHWIAEEVPGNRPIGYAILTGLDDPDGSLCLKRIVVAEKGHGHGRQVLRHLKRMVFEELGAHRFWLDVKTHNTRAKHLYESEGFVFEGILRECLRSEDGYESLAVLSVLQWEYRG
jgi:RimJ/RimL family protein N-acetyltransferase